METNFKVDVPSFALGYSVGKKKGGSGGGVELNIAYGDTPPEDTSKLWVKCEKPIGVSASPFITTINGEKVKDERMVSELLETFPTGMLGGGMSCATVGDYIYIFGGADTVYRSYIWRFDSTNEELHIITTDALAKIYNRACAAIGTKIYLFGGKASGDNPLTSIHCFDTTTNEMTRLEEALPQQIMQMSCAAIGTKIYLFGGQVLYSNASSAIYCFDAEDEKIRTLDTSLPKSINGMACAAIGTKIYLFGGNNAKTNFYDNIYCFDSETEKISEIPSSLPLKMAYASGVTIGNEIYLFGGYANGTAYDHIHRFDAEENRVFECDIKMPRAESRMTAAELGSSIYLFAGDYNNYIYCNKKPEALVIDGFIHIVSSGEKNLFRIIDGRTETVEICVSSVYKGNSDGIGKSVDAFLYADGWKRI